jgi:hypothetical protein
MTKKKPTAGAKAKKQESIVTFLLDRSGSMGSIQDATIEAFNAYVSELKKAPNPVGFTFLQFDSQSLDKIHVAMPIAKVPALNRQTFQPRASTPLIDAAVKTIKAVEAALTTRDDQPKVVVCFQTDGQENCSREFTWDILQDLIKEKTAAGWQFLFMGASIDAYAQGSKMGISTDNTMSYDSKDLGSTVRAFRATASNTVMFGSGMAATAAYSGAQKMAAGDAFDPATKNTKAAKPAARRSIVDDIKL